MYKILWKVTDDDRERLCSLGKLAGEECYKSITNVLEKEKFTLEDLTEIKDILPSNLPVFAFFNKLCIHHEAIEFKSSEEFRKKTEKLRLQQEAQAYRKIIESVDPSQRYGKVDHMENFGVELKAVNRQLVSVLNVLITVVGAFFFGFSGVGYAYPHLHLEIATRFIIGLILATIVFFADIYFVIKNMDHDVNCDNNLSSNVLSFKNMSKNESSKKND